MQLATFSSAQHHHFAVPGIASAAFSNLSGEALSHFDQISMDLSYTRGARLFGEDEEPKSIFVLLNGRVKLSVTSREGRTAILRIASAGDVLGLSAALAGIHHEVSAEVLEPVRAQVTRSWVAVTRNPLSASWLFRPVKKGSSVPVGLPVRGSNTA